MPVIVQLCRCFLLFKLWRTFRSKGNAIPAGDKNCSPFHRNWRSLSDRNTVRIHNGIAFGFARIPHQIPFHPEIPTTFRTLAPFSSASPVSFHSALGISVSKRSSHLFITENDRSGEDGCLSRFDPLSASFVQRGAQNCERTHAGIRKQP
jgi:hypothetical protein